MSNLSTFVGQQIKYLLSLIFLKFSFERRAQLVARSLHEARGPRFESRAPRLTEFFFLLVYDDILLASYFFISFYSLSLFVSN